MSFALFMVFLARFLTRFGRFSVMIRYFQNLKRVLDRPTLDTGCHLVRLIYREEKRGHPQAQLSSVATPIHES